MPSTKSALGRLNNGRGIEWYHLVLVALVIGYFAYSSGFSKGVLLTQHCDTHSVIMTANRFPVGYFTPDLHACDTMVFKNRDARDYTLMINLTEKLAFIPVGQDFTYQFQTNGTYMFHTLEGPDSMMLKVVVT